MDTALLIVAIPVAIAVLAFWVWMLVDCLLHEPSDGSDKVAWTLVIVLMQLLGAILYYLVRRPRRITDAPAAS